MTNLSDDNGKHGKNDKLIEVKKTYQSPQFTIYGSLNNLTNGSSGHYSDSNGKSRANP
jgi:hypothetical protein